jgi:hypothetical protein
MRRTVLITMLAASLALGAASFAVAEDVVVTAAVGNAFEMTITGDRHSTS